VDVPAEDLRAGLRSSDDSGNGEWPVQLSAKNLQALLFGGAELPVRLSDETLRLLGRLDDDLSELVQRIGESRRAGRSIRSLLETSGELSIRRLFRSARL
jgi:hypothetical protein